MTDDQFAREARRWTASHQPDRGEASFRRRRRARRWLRLWDGDSGMTQLRGELDPVTGERIRNRLEAEARRLRRSDTGKACGAGDGGDGGGGDGGVGGDGGGDGKRSFAQAMADALDGLTDIGTSIGRIAGGSAGGRGPAGSSDPDPAGRSGNDHTGSPATNSAGAPARTNGTTGDSATLFGTSAGGHQAGGSGSRRKGSRGGQGGRGSRGPGDRSGERTASDSDGVCDCGRKKRGGRPIADIAVVSHVDSVTGELVSQLATGEPLPPSVLDLLSCNAALTGVLYDTAGTPLWQGTTRRTATAAQLKALIARDGGCIGCGCHPALCQAHHIRPVCRGGLTTIANMTLLCWHCHNKVHHNQWRVLRRNGRLVLEPPVRTRWGPARAP